MADKVYIGAYNNTVNYRLEVSGAALDLSTTTVIQANINGIIVSSTNQATDLIRWEQDGYVSGEIRCEFGSIPGIRESTATCNIILYEPSNPSGIVFSATSLLFEKLR